MPWARQVPATSSVANAASRAVQPALRQQLGQHQVGVGVLAVDPAQGVERQPAGPVGRTGRRSGTQTYQSAERRLAVEADPAGPVGGGHRLLALRLHLTQLQGPGARCRPAPRTSSPRGRPGGRWLAATRAELILKRSPRKVVHAPGAGAQPRISRSTASAGSAQEISASVDVELGRVAGRALRLRHRGQRPVLDAVEGLDQQLGPADREPAQQVAGGVGRAGSAR